jgi:hypothetical protein
MEMELPFLLYLVFSVIVFFVIIYLKGLLCTKALDFEILSNISIQNF